MVISGGWRVETVVGEGVGRRGLGLGQAQVCARHIVLFLLKYLRVGTSGWGKAREGLCFGGMWPYESGAHVRLHLKLLLLLAREQLVQGVRACVWLCVRACVRVFVRACGSGWWQSVVDGRLGGWGWGEW